MATMLRDAFADPVVSAGTADELEAIRLPYVGLTLWARQIPADLDAQLAELDFGTVDDMEFMVELPTSAATLATNLVVSGYDQAIAPLLAADMLALATRHAAITRSARLMIRLEVVETDACRRFHTDQVTYRLLTTYRGAATQWVRAEEPDAVQQMRAGNVAIFKGRVLLDEPPILHRSPPIEGSGTQRLLLVVDPVIGD